MADHNATIGSFSAKDDAVAVGRGPHVFRNYPLKTDQDALPAGQVVGLDAAGEVVPFGTAQAVSVGTGDGSGKAFSGNLGPRVLPGSVSITDGTETFSDDGFGNLTGDAGGEGNVNYATGQITVTFNAAPADSADVQAGYKPGMRGVLSMPAEAGAADAEVLVFGPVAREKLLVGESAPSASQLLELDILGLWPIG